MPPDAKIISSTWDMKKKSAGTHSARINTRRFELQDGVRYTKDDFPGLVVNGITINIVIILMIMAAWRAELINVKGALLTGKFDNG